MSRTQFVARVAWSVSCVVLLHAQACSCGPPIEVVDGGPIDAAPDDDVGRDASTPPGPDAACGSGTGQIGDHCRSGATAACASGSDCIDLSARSHDVESVFGYRQGGDDDVAHPGYPLARDVVDPLASAPFNAAAGTLCAAQCDASLRTDPCGACTSCETTLTQMPLVAAFGGARVLFGTAAAYGASTGVCRLDCTWSPTSRGDECPSEMACDAFGSVCIEACTTDNECNTNYGVTYEGEVVTVLDTAHPRACNPTTGRCEDVGTTGASVGDACESSDACAPGTGVCLAGGRCAEFGCASPDTSASTCASGAGVCLSVNQTSHPQTLCLQGCAASSDCGAGNVCTPFGGGFAIGAFTGYCLGICHADDECIGSEACTDGTTVDATGATVATPGQCVPRCTGVGEVGAASGGCDATEMCVADHAGAAYGHCAPADHFCGEPDTRSLPAADPECATGWVCDELLAGLPAQHELVADGHCTPACASDADCTGATTCVLAGALAGLCRDACTSDTDCTAPRVCDTTLGACVEAAPPPP